MAINRNNYESFFLDYLEGNLSKGLLGELELFLKENPDLAAELQEMREVRDELNFSAEEDILFDSKQNLKKDFDTALSERVDELLVKELEGDLSAEEVIELNKLENENPVVNRIRVALAHTKFSASALEYPEKEQLRISDKIELTSEEEWLIAFMENDLSADERQIIEESLAANDVMRSKLSLLEQTRLQKEELSFPNKKLLYKEEIPVFSLRKLLYVTSAAASIALLIGLFTRLQHSPALPATAYLSDSEWRLNPVADTTSPVVAAKEEMNNVNKQKKIEQRNNINVFHEEQTAEFKSSSPTEESAKNYMKSLDWTELEIQASDKDLKWNFPEMKKIYEEPIPVAEHKQEKTVTLWAYLGQVATEKVKETNAYQYAEQRIETIVDRSAQNFHLELPSDEASEKVLLRIGSLEIQKPVSGRSEGKRQKFLDKARQVWDAQ